MRWYEILNESDFDNDVKSFIIDILIPFDSNKVDKVPVSKIVSVLKNANILTGISIDEPFVSEILQDIPMVSKVEPDHENNGAMTAYLQFEPSETKSEGDPEEKINKSAMKALKKKFDD